MAALGHSHVTGHRWDLLCGSTPIPARHSVYLGRRGMRRECETLRTISLPRDGPPLSCPWALFRPNRLRSTEPAVALDRDNFRGRDVYRIRARIHRFAIRAESPESADDIMDSIAAFGPISEMAPSRISRNRPNDVENSPPACADARRRQLDFYRYRPVLRFARPGEPRQLADFQPCRPRQLR
jgi:hypothetical protein